MSKIKVGYNQYKDLLESENDRLRKRIASLETEVKRENKSHNYHCKESQRKNDVIDKLREALEKIEFKFSDHNCAFVAESALKECFGEENE